ncbi:MAG: ABC transporter substrate-binding protein [Proteobacteria bacterium]|nr:ABC transporter substrate-binding protein [Pseudomonadota bacterium]
MAAARAGYGSIIGPQALVAALLIGGLTACSAGNFDKQPCKADGSCAAALGAGYFCGSGGFCERPAASAPGVCEGTIPIKILHDNSGPLKEVGRSYWKGEIDFLREVNDAGGVRGCKFDVDSFDYAYAVDKATEQYAAWSADTATWERVVAVLGFGTGDTLALGPKLAEDKKLMISGSWVGKVASPKEVFWDIKDVPSINESFVETLQDQRLGSTGFPYNFFVGTDYSNSIRAAVDYIAREATAAGADRIGFFHCSAGYCTEPLPAGQTYAKKAGLALGRNLKIELSYVPDAGYAGTAEEFMQAKVDTLVHDYFVKEAEQVKATGGTYKPVSWVWIANTNPSAFRMGKALQKVRDDVTTTGAFDGTLKEHFANVKSISNVWGYDEFTIRDCKRNRDTAPPDAWCVDHFLGVLPMAVYGGTAAGMAELERVHNKWRAADSQLPETDPISDATTGATARAYQDVQYVKGYTSAMLLTRGLERLVDQKDRPISGENLKAALETGVPISTDGLTPQLKYTEDDHRPQASAKIYKIDNAGAFAQVGTERTIVFQAQSLGW